MGYYSELSYGDLVAVAVDECDCLYNAVHPSVVVAMVEGIDDEFIYAHEGRYSIVDGYLDGCEGDEFHKILDPASSLDAEYALLSVELEQVTAMLLDPTNTDILHLKEREALLELKLDDLADQIVYRD